MSDVRRVGLDICWRFCFIGGGRPTEMVDVLTTVRLHFHLLASINTARVVVSVS